MGIFGDYTIEQLIDLIKAKEREKLSKLPPDQLFSYDLESGWDSFTREELEEMYVKLMEESHGNIWGSNFRSIRK